MNEIYNDVKNLKYHQMSFQEIGEIRAQIEKGELTFCIDQTRLMLYLNAMPKKYSLVLRLLQDATIIFIVSIITFLFIDWKFSVLFFVLMIGIGVLNKHVANSYIGFLCRKDNAFLKMSLATELIKIN